MKKIMRIAVIDDDQKVRENIKMLLSMYVKEAEIIAEASGVHEGIACLKSNTLDLVLLDIEMKDGSGFDMLSLYGKIDFEVVFVTGHDGYAIKAFKYNALDYILKPIDPDDLVAAINKVKFKEKSHKITKKDNKVTKKDGNILLRDADAVYLIRINNIVRCQSDVNYTTFYLENGKEITVSKTLKEYDKLLAGNNFFRVHQSHLINLTHFDRYEKKDGGVVYMKNNSCLPVAIRRKDALMRELEIF